ncbi:serine hydrolase domain-containing protein [Hufsiella ginkgonis]|uniref:Serine hydrolase n=1 Tax=Hufsiella ginkgonis TaxID=2695274 RepID=A0A7K1XXH7_9SPHI|nr:serine hydrolase domain-containing protein [Hufsiella ginkgonis]MXV15643.1 serine hydrolase [Hufsiella ginkgonis]
MNVKILFATITTLAFSFAATAQMPDKAKLDQLFDRLAEKNKGMGTLVITKDGNPVYTRSFGYGQISETAKKPLTEASRYRIASVTKMFTSVMILQLVEEGKLKLTDNIHTYFPQVPNAQKITIAQLLSHRSGVPNVKPGQEKTAPVTKDEMLALIAKAAPDFEPDTKHIYSNSGYFLLGLIVEKLTGKPYGEALAARITSKAGLKDTYVATGGIDVNKNESLTYFYIDGVWKQMPETHPSILFGAGSIVSTPNDMARFAQALFGGKLISREHLDLAKTMRDGDGFGMETFLFTGKTFYGHTGGGDNYGAWLAYLPEEKLAVAYASNAKGYPVADIMQGIVDIYYNKPYTIPTFETVSISQEILDSYTGVYSMPGAPVKFTVTRDGSTLYFHPPGGQSPAPLEATAPDKFKIEGAMVIEFDAAKKQMTIKRGGGERVFTKEN